jgi:hypothetical protein
MKDNKSKYDKLMKTIDLLKKIKNQSKKHKENNKELNDMQVARNKFDKILHMDNSFNKYFKGKKINNDDEPDFKDDHDLNDSDACHSNYHFYNKSYKLLKLPKKLEYNKVINFDIFPEYEAIQKYINKFCYYSLIIVVLIYGLIKLSKFMKK